MTGLLPHKTRIDVVLLLDLDPLLSDCCRKTQLSRDGIRKSAMIVFEYIAQAIDFANYILIENIANIIS